VGTLAFAPRGAVSTLRERFGETQLLYTYLMRLLAASLPERSPPQLLAAAPSGGLHTLTTQRMRWASSTIFYPAFKDLSDSSIRDTPNNGRIISAYKRDYRTEQDYALLFHSGHVNGFVYLIEDFKNGISNLLVPPPEVRNLSL
jgi:hypothetical protein